ncbi:MULTISPECIES: hypothetical protein [unclassified Desulfurobacterium]|uniref:hypothetical protein n=1 Tax=unclassified Desulfurobacterium TaxID=2639089 RepID=UPI0003B3784A|nr:MULTISPECIES: hypothetical protein [unclassified Desulfurobacterium]
MEDRKEIMEENFDKNSKYKAELENISVSLFALFEKLEKEYEDKVQELSERCEALEQENVELKYKLRQLSEELKTLGEKIVAEVIKRTSLPPENFGNDTNGGDL